MARMDVPSAVARAVAHEHERAGALPIGDVRIVWVDVGSSDDVG
jgi:hypothetical protein